MQLKELLKNIFNYEKKETYTQEDLKNLLNQHQNFIITNLQTPIDDLISQTTKENNINIETLNKQIKDLQLTIENKDKEIIQEKTNILNNKAINSIKNFVFDNSEKDVLNYIQNNEKIKKPFFDLITNEKIEDIQPFLKENVFKNKPFFEKRKLVSTSNIKPDDETKIVVNQELQPNELNINQAEYEKYKPKKAY